MCINFIFASYKSKLLSEIFEMALCKKKKKIQYFVLSEDWAKQKIKPKETKFLLIIDEMIQ